MTPRKKKEEAHVGPWEESVGFLPHKVTVYENMARGGTLYLRWRAGGNWRKQSLQRALRVGGKIDAATQEWAKERASTKYAELVKAATLQEAEQLTGVATALTIPEPKAAPLTIREGLAKAIDEETGKYPTDTMHRREVVREVGRAAVVWNNAPWNTIRRADLRKLWRHRIKELRAQGETGLRGAEITVQRVLAVAAWLRDEEHIEAGACAAKKEWKEDLRSDWLELTKERSVPNPKRPRHTLAEMRRILAKAGAVDPRFELLMVLGAEIRLGQVARCRRTDLDFTHGTLTVHGKKGKRGVVLKLTAGQLRVARHAVERGYLRRLEQTQADYPLFPAGQLRGGWKGEDPVALEATLRRATRADTEKSRGALDAVHVGRRTINAWFHDAERAAGIDPVPGRAAYGLKRAAVDAVKQAGISREGLMAHAGWTDTQMADQVYADQAAEWAREEAAKHRAKLRGEETEAGTDPVPPRTQDVPTNETRRTDGYAAHGEHSE